MIAISINLLVEEQQAQEARARDPFKAIIAVGLSLMALTVVAGGVISEFATRKIGEESNLEERLATVKSAALIAHEASWETAQGAVKDIVALHQSRTLMAPKIAMLKDMVPTAVRLSGLHFAIAAEENDPEADPSQGTGEGGKRARRPKLTERLTLRMEGEAISNRPELDVDAFIQSLRNDPQFSAEVPRIQLRSISRTEGSSENGVPKLPKANFVIECQYKGGEAK